MRKSQQSTGRDLLCSARSRNRSAAEMWKRSVALTVSAIVCAAAAPPPVSLYGVELGEPLVITECAVGTPEAAICSKPFVGSISSLLPGAMRQVFVYFARDGRPAIAKGASFEVGVLDGRVEEIAVFTGGSAVQKDALEQLTAKFGKPAELRTETLRNGFGVEYPNIRAVWILQGGTTVGLNGVSGRVDEGSITAFTSKARDYHARERALEQAKQPQL